MLKLLGIFVTISSCFLFGYLKSKEYKNRVKDIRDLIQILNFVKNEMLIYNNLIHEIFIKIREITKSPLCAIFENTIEEIRKTPHISLEKAWEKGLESSRDKLFLIKDDIEIINNFGLMLEKSDLEGQTRNIEYLQKRLENQEKIAIDKDLKDGKLIKIAGLLVGLGITVVLY